MFIVDNSTILLILPIGESLHVLMFRWLLLSHANTAERIWMTLGIEDSEETLGEQFYIIGSR